jgi:ParB-like chromosome segregation protein Spo0J
MIMRIETIPIKKIKRAKYNPRRDLKPGDPEYQSLKRVIDRFGFLLPLVWNERTGVLVGGHQRLSVLEAEGATEVTVSVVNLDEAHERALNVALNNIEGDWDNEVLIRVLSELKDSGSDLALTGFDDEELMRLLDWRPDAVSFPEYDESVEGEVEMVQCEVCGYEFPR